MTKMAAPHALHLNLDDVTPLKSGTSSSNNGVYTTSDNNRSSASSSSSTTSTTSSAPTTGYGFGSSFGGDGSGGMPRTDYPKLGAFPALKGSNSNGGVDSNLPALVLPLATLPAPTTTRHVGSIAGAGGGGGGGSVGASPSRAPLAARGSRRGSVTLAPLNTGDDNNNIDNNNDMIRSSTALDLDAQRAALQAQQQKRALELR
jgi:hypothetical protein